MTHFVCKGECNGQSDQPGLCQDPICSQNGSPLTPCDCEDNMHGKEQEEVQENSI